MPRLPSLKALRAFDVTSRHRSFTSAAHELNVTHGAVSRQIAALEQELGIPLFVRDSRNLALTPEGEKLARKTRAAFELLVAATKGLVPTAGRSLRILVPPAFATSWLSPRLGSMRDAYPDLSVEVSTSAVRSDFGSTKYDAFIRRIHSRPRAMLCVTLLDARAVPVCSPWYKEAYLHDNGLDFRRATLLATRSEPDAWRGWLRSRRLKGAAGEPIIFEQMYLALQAAVDSHGVALAPLAIAEQEISTGRLCALAEPQGPRRPVYALLAPLAASRRADIDRLAAWLLDQADTGGHQSNERLDRSAEPPRN